MSELKYLSDGRKVSVIGKINKTEYIVQEVFITESGDEIPSGENFTAKSLHDSPVLSWKERETKKYEARYESAKDELSSMQKELRLMKHKRQAHSDLLKSNDKLVNAMQDCDLSFLADVITGNVKWVCPNGWGWDRPTLFEDKIYQWSCGYGEKSYEGIKMLSVFGYSHNYHNRKFRFSIGQYYDESGSGSEYEFFKTDEDLNNFLIERYKKAHKEERLSISNIKNISKYITVEKNVIDNVLQKEINSNKESYDKDIARAKESFDKRKSELIKINSPLKELEE